MAALTDNKVVKTGDGKYQAYPVEASTTIYRGAAVCANADGYSVPAADTAGLVTRGYAVAKADNSSGADGAIDVTVVRTGLLKVAKGTAVDTDLDVLMYWVDDQTVGEVGDTTNDILAGKCVEILDGSNIMIDIAVATQA